MNPTEQDLDNYDPGAYVVSGDNDYDADYLNDWAREDDWYED